MRCRPMNSCVCPVGSMRTLCRSQTFCRSVLPMEDFHSMRTDLRTLTVGRNGTMPLHPVAPWPLDRDSNTDPWTCRNRSHRDSTILDRQLALRQVQPVVPDRDAERPGQVAGTT